MNAIIQKWQAIIDQIAGYILLAGVLALAGLLVSKQWRDNPLLPLAALLTGPLFGLFGATLWGEAGAIAMTFIGTLGGPTIVALGQDPQILRRIVDHTLDKIAPRQRDKDS